jgi:uncharacterized protein (TIGR02118 family)
VPKATAVPRSKGIALTRIDSGLEGGAAPFYRVAEMLFESPEAMEESARSELRQAMREDARRMIERFGVTLTVGIGSVEETNR